MQSGSELRQRMSSRASSRVPIYLPAVFWQYLTMILGNMYEDSVAQPDDDNFDVHTPDTNQESCIY